jgi:hypothetical protein
MFKSLKHKVRHAGPLRCPFCRAERLREPDMANVTLKPGGELTLPKMLCERYGMTPEVPIRIIETRSGLLLIPLTRAPMDAELEKELAEWQQLSRSVWDAFPYQEHE